MKHYQIRQSITDRSSISVDMYLKDIAKYPLLTEEEERELINKCKTDSSAIEKLINSNLRFVVSIAKQYQGKGIDLADLISVGNLGLMEAANKFDSSFGFRFLSYAVWWIRNYMLKEILQNGKVIRIPAGKISSFNKINKIISDFEQKNGHAPTNSEIAELMNITEEEIQKIYDFGNISIISETITSKDGSEESIFETISTENSNSDIILDKTSDKFDIVAILKRNLNKIEFEIINEFFGITTDQNKIESIAEKHNITSERVRQIKDKCIIKLRKSNDFSKLNNYL